MNAIKQYRHQLDGVMKHKIPAYKKGEIAFPWTLVSYRETKYSFDYCYEVPSGYGLIDLEKQIDAFFAATGCIVELEDHAGQIVMSVFPHDFATIIPFHKEMLSTLKKGELLIGFDRRNHPITHNLNMAANKSLILGGASGYGKTDALRLIIYTLLTQYKLDEIEFWVIDGKGISFMPFMAIPNFRIITDDLYASVSMLAEAYELLVKRRDQILNREIKRSEVGKLKQIFIIIDEIAELAPSEQVTKADKEAAQMAQKYLSHMSRLGREMQFGLILCTQRPTVDVIPGAIRTNITSKVCFKTDNIIDSQVILGQGNTAGATLPFIKGRAIYYHDAKNKVLQVPFVGIDEVWEELLTPFYWKGAKENGSHWKLPNKKPVETSDFADIEDITPMQDGTDSTAPSGAPNESTKTGFRDIKGTGKKRSFSGESGTQSDIGGVESVPFESARAKNDGDYETTDTFEYD